MEEALTLYTSVFANSRIKAITRYGEAGPGTKGEIMTAIFELAGQEFVIINGSPGFPHSPAMSLSRTIHPAPAARDSPALSLSSAAANPASLITLRTLRAIKLAGSAQDPSAESSVVPTGYVCACKVR